MAEEKELHILLADDSEVFREGVKSILQFEEGISVNGEVSSCGELIQMLAYGASVKEISVILEINITTIESYKERIKNKLGVNTMIEAIVFAVKCDFI